MTELLTSAQMRAIEKAAIESGDVTGLELMERAGRGVVEAIFEEWPELAQVPQAERRASPPHPPEYFQNNERDWVRRAVVLCGPGNNGGDGFVVARLLRERGWDVEVFLYGDPGKLPPDARVNYERWGELGEAIKPIKQAPSAMNEITVSGRLVVIDALFGTGLKRPIPEELADTLEQLHTYRPEFYKQIVAVDVPSGVCADSGKIIRAAKHANNLLPYGSEVVAADLTISFGWKKLFAASVNGMKFAGRIKVADIGLLRSEAAVACLSDKYAELARVVERVYLGNKDEPCSYKYTHGHALILSGGLGKTGAARLAARGALRIGAGLVTVGAPGEGLAENATQLTAIMLRGVEDATALAETLKDDRINALCLGPGLGLDRARALVPVALAGKGRAVVLDADALTGFADDPAALFAMLHENCVLTPHAGEFARLFPDIAEKLNAPATKGPAFSKVDATREAAKRAGCVVLFKGADTVIAQPDGRCSINAALYERSAPWLATAGSGDVLAGFITGLLARGFGPMQAAEAAAWLHVECALTFGPGLIAEDLPEQLPAVFRGLGL